MSSVVLNIVTQKSYLWFLYNRNWEFAWNCQHEFHHVSPQPTLHSHMWRPAPVSESVTVFLTSLKVSFEVNNHGENILTGQMVWSGWKEWRQVWGVRGEIGWWVCKVQVISKSKSYDATIAFLMEGSVERNSCIVRLACRLYEPCQVHIMHILINHNN